MARWLATTDSPIGRNALARHASAHLGVQLTPGRRPVSGSFLEAVRDRAHEDLAAGRLAPSIRDGIAAETELGRRADKGADRDLILQLAQVLGGAVALPTVIDGEYAEVDEEAAEDEAAFARLAAGESMPADPLPAGAVPAGRPRPHPGRAHRRFWR